MTNPLQLAAEVAHRQWRDVLSLFELAPDLDHCYLRTAAGEVGLIELLDMAAGQVDT